MATTRETIEELLTSWNPGIDLSPSSSVHREVIDPLMEMLGESPLDSDIEQFMLDRLAQEHADLVPTRGDALHQLMISPMRTLLEPFRREVARVLQLQSVDNPQVTGDDADALLSNLFVDPRLLGAKASGVARLYFSSPSQQVIGSGNVAVSTSGLRFSPAGTNTIDAVEMAGNIEGGLYYMDVVFIAEEEGDEYNIEPDTLVSMVGMPTVVRVINKDKFSGGRPAETLDELRTRARQSLTERSLNTALGISARMSDLFPGGYNFLEVVRHGDPDMKRDILKATSGEVIHHTGLGIPVDDMFLVSTDQVLGAVVAKEGDTLVLMYPPYLYDDDNPDINDVPTKRIETYKINKVQTGVVFGGLTTTIYHLDGTPTQMDMDQPAQPPDDVSAVVYWVRSPAPITVSDIPGGIKQSDGAIEVASGEVHLGGKVDVYVQPDDVVSESAVLGTVSDEAPLVSGTDLKRSANGAHKGVVESATANFVTAGVRAGDILQIETVEIGFYRILEVNSETQLLVDKTFDVAFLNARYKVSRSMKVDLVEPKTIKLPHGNIGGGGLSTVAGSKVFDTGATDAQSMGVVAGDTFRVLDGDSAGDYTITGFQGLGNLVLVDKAAVETEGGLTYEIFTKGDGVNRPMVRVSKVQLSSGTGVSHSVPYGLPVLNRMQCAVRGAKVTKAGDYLTVLPKLDINDFPAAQNYEFSGRDDIQSEDEGDVLPDFVFGPENGRSACFVAFPNMVTDAVMAFLDQPNYYSAGNPGARLIEDYGKAELADAVKGDILEVLDGANVGAYTVKEVKTVEFTKAVKFTVIGGGEVDGTLKMNVTFVTVDETIPETSVPYTIRLLKKLKVAGGTKPYERIDTELDDERQALEDFGFAYNADPTVREIAAIWASALTGYQIGERGTGVLRMYFLEPLWFFMTKALRFATEAGLKYRLPLDAEVQVRPARSITDFRNYLRDLVVDPNSVGDNDKIGLGTWSSQPITYVKGDSTWAADIRKDDVVEVHAERPVHPQGPAVARIALVTTVAGSDEIELPAIGNYVYKLDPTLVTDMATLETTSDKGDYLITKKVSASKIRLDKPMTKTRGVVLAGEDITGDPNARGSFEDVGGVKKMRRGDNTRVFTQAHVGSWLQTPPDGAVVAGVYKITGVEDEVAGNFKYLILDDPDDVIVNGATGTWAIVNHEEGMPHIRVYAHDATRYTVTGVTTTDREDTIFDIDSDADYSVRAPYRVMRPGKMIGPKDMKDQESGMWYVDCDILSDGVSAGYNVAEGTPVREDAEWRSEGYTVKSNNLATTFSDEEDVDIFLPTQVLPSGVDDEIDNRVNVAGRGVQVTYESAPLLSRMQAVMDSASERVAVADGLVKHALPAYVFLEVKYNAGEVPAVLVPQLRALIDATRGDERLEISDLEALISSSGATFVDQDIVLLALYHGLDRRLQAARTANFFSGNDNPAFVEGTRSIMSYISGPDRTGEEDAVGERTSLSRG